MLKYFLLLFLTIGLLLSGCKSSASLTQAEIETYDEIENFYQQQIDNDQPLTLYDSEGLQQIILIRHGNPIIDKKKRVGFRGMRQYIYDYDTVHVQPIDHSPVAISIDDVDTVFSSSLQRAQHTARQIFGTTIPIKVDYSFRELEREVVPIPLIKFRPKTWSIIGRVLWMAGIRSSSIEGRRQANKRVADRTDFLIQQAQSKTNAVLVAHGFLNHKLKKALVKKGWQHSYDSGNDYLSVQILTKLKSGK